MGKARFECANGLRLAEALRHVRARRCEAPALARDGERAVEKDGGRPRARARVCSRRSPEKNGRRTRAPATGRLRPWRGLSNRRACRLALGRTVIGRVWIGPRHAGCFGRSVPCASSRGSIPATGTGILDLPGPPRTPDGRDPLGPVAALGARDDLRLEAPFDTRRTAGKQQHACLLHRNEAVRASEEPRCVDNHGPLPDPGACAQSAHSSWFGKVGPAGSDKNGDAS